jgi:alcohol dehydrogenase
MVSSSPEVVHPFEFVPRTRVVFGTGALSRLGQLAAELGLSRTLLVADPGLVATGYVARAAGLLEAAGVAPFGFHDFDANPDSRMVEAGRLFAASNSVDSIVAIGGGSSLDCAKGINFVLTGGGSMRDYRGFGKVGRPMLPSIGVPTTAGTGSEAQSYAIISDAETHAKMACGDPGAAFKVAILDPSLTTTLPAGVTAIAGYDAVSHAVEAYVTRKRNRVSALFACDAWRLLASGFARVLDTPGDEAARGAMLLGSHEAGIAIEQSMLGATHALANPLTAMHGTIHGVAIAVMLPHVVRWNGEVVGDRYAELLHAVGDTEATPATAGGRLADRLWALARRGGLPASLGEIGVSLAELPALAADAATQWTGTFNPRPFGVAEALGLYEKAI